MPIRDFNAVLSEAVSDLVENGFDSVERVERWTRALREAADRSLISPASLEQQLRDALAAIYRKMVDHGDVFRFNPQVERFTLERVRPALRSELDRRIIASANLIKLNRSESIDKTLRRFQGWSTSIPAGGVAREKKSEVRANVRKSLAQLPFEERRVLIDQGHKLTAALSEILATDGGAIACRWRSHWRQPGYDYREDHKERDEKIYLVRDSWAHRAGFVKKGRVGYFDEITAPGQEPFCRCYVVWLYNLRELPDDMLTAKGRSSLREVAEHEALRRGGARTDSVNAKTDADYANPIPEVFAAAVRADVLRFIADVKVRASDRESRWHAQYGDGEIVLFENFSKLSFTAQVQTILHEAGHRGQDVDKATYKEFKRRHEGKLGSFLHMANDAHLQDYEKTGKVDSVDAEVFAESYARFCLNLNMPAELAEFWRERVSRETPKIGPAAMRMRLDALEKKLEAVL